MRPHFVHEPNGVGRLSLLAPPPPLWTTTPCPNSTNIGRVKPYAGQVRRNSADVGRLGQIRQIWVELGPNLGCKSKHSTTWAKLFGNFWATSEQWRATARQLWGDLILSTITGLFKAANFTTQGRPWRIAAPVHDAVVMMSRGPPLPFEPRNLFAALRFGASTNYTKCWFRTSFAFEVGETGRNNAEFAHIWPNPGPKWTHASQSW